LINRLTDRSVVGVQVFRSHKLRHQGALANGGGAQHKDAVRRWTLRRAALPRTRQRARRRIPRRSRIRGSQVFRAASNRRKARRVLRLAQNKVTSSITSSITSYQYAFHKDLKGFFEYSSIRENREYSSIRENYATSFLILGFRRFWGGFLGIFRNCRLLALLNECRGHSVSFEILIF